MLENLVQKIDGVLPQTQCTRCGYPSCLDYAEALAGGTAQINQCPPGGDDGIKKLSQLLNKEALPLNPANGTIKPRTLAFIEEDACIGCTLCIKACPVDAILGTNKMMHTVIADECTGCDLCLPVCPVDCIKLIDAPDQEWGEDKRNHSKMRFEEHKNRLARNKLEREQRLAASAVKQDHNPGDLLANILAKVK